MVAGMLIPLGITLLLSVAASATAEEMKRYDGYQLIAVTPQDDEQLAAVKEWLLSHPQVDCWKEPSGLHKAVHMMFPPGLPQLFLTQLRLAGTQPKILVDNVQTLVSAERLEMDRLEPKQTVHIDHYNSLDNIYTWLDYLASSYPDIARVMSIGQSFEQRPLKIIKIGKPSAQSKRAFWIHGGAHAREWVSPATAVYIIHELVTKYSLNPVYKQLVDQLDFYIMPVLNPDGYEYSRGHERLWRKTRSGPICHTPSGRCCYGADPNRNWDVDWGVASTSSDPCAQIFGGTAPFSEAEVRAVARFVGAHNDTIAAFMAMHAYGELWFYPYGFLANHYPPDIAQIRAGVAQAVASIRAVHGTNYTAGTPADIFYAASGSSMDWAKAVANVKWSFGMELRPGDGDHDNDHFGFLLPARFIRPTAEEAWAGFQTIARLLLP